MNVPPSQFSSVSHDVTSRRRDVTLLSSECANAETRVLWSDARGNTTRTHLHDSIDGVVEPWRGALRHQQRQRILPHKAKTSPLGRDMSEQHDLGCELDLKPDGVEHEASIVRSPAQADAQPALLWLMALNVGAGWDARVWDSAVFHSEGCCDARCNEKSLSTAGWNPVGPGVRNSNDRRHIINQGARCASFVNSWHRRFAGALQLTISNNCSVCEACVNGTWDGSSDYIWQPSRSVSRTATHNNEMH